MSCRVGWGGITNTGETEMKISRIVVTVRRQIRQYEPAEITMEAITDSPAGNFDDPTTVVRDLNFEINRAFEMVWGK